MNKLGLCLSGGGARGAYQIGAIAALKDLNIFPEIKAYAGTSIGAANLAMVLSSSIDEAKSVWNNIPKKPIAKTIQDPLEKEILRPLDRGMFSISFLIKTLNQLITDNSFKDSEVYITIANAGDEGTSFFELFRLTYEHYFKKDSKVQYMPLHDFKKNDCIDIVRASCSIPLVFSAVVRDNKKYYDGGVFDATPIKPLVDAGCDEIILVNISIKTKFNKTVDQFPNLKIHEIKPSTRIGFPLDFSNKHSMQLYELGYQDTYNYFKSLNKM